MKIAVTGKGGTGKTTIAGILSRTLARAGSEVVAVDADPNPNLAVALGMGVQAAAALESVTNVLLREKAGHAHEPGEDHAHDPPESAEDLLVRLGADAPDNVRLIQTGIIERPSDGCLCCGSHRTSRRIFDEIDGTGRVVVADLEAGVIDLLWVWPKPEDCALVVTEPYLKSLEVARRALEVTRDFAVGQVIVVANRLSGPADLERVRKYLPGQRVVGIPDDRAISLAARKGTSPVDEPGDHPAVRAVGDLVKLLQHPEEVGVPGPQGRST